MKHFVGTRTSDGFEVDVLDQSFEKGGYPLTPRDGQSFAWGTSGTGSLNLAYALLQDVLEDEGLARRLAPDFKRTVIAQLPEDGFTLSEEDLRQAVMVADVQRGRKK